MHQVREQQQLLENHLTSKKGMTNEQRIKAKKMINNFHSFSYSTFAFSCSRTISTCVILPWRKWQSACKQYNIAGYKQIIHNMRYDWNIEVPKDAKPVSSSNNFVPPDEHISVFRDTVKGLKTGFLLGPFTPHSKFAKNIILSPLQIVVKPNTHRFLLVSFC